MLCLSAAHGAYFFLVPFNRALPAYLLPPSVVGLILLSQGNWAYTDFFIWVLQIIWQSERFGTLPKAGHVSHTIPLPQAVLTQAVLIGKTKARFNYSPTVLPTHPGIRVQGHPWAWTSTDAMRSVCTVKVTGDWGVRGSEPSHRLRGLFILPSSKNPKEPSAPELCGLKGLLRP